MKVKDQKKIMISVTDELNAELDVLCKEEHRSKNNLINMLLHDLFLNPQPSYLFTRVMEKKNAD